MFKMLKQGYYYHTYAEEEPIQFKETSSPNNTRNVSTDLILGLVPISLDFACAYQANKISDNSDWTFTKGLALGTSALKSISYASELYYK